MRTSRHVAADFSWYAEGRGAAKSNAAMQCAIKIARHLAIACTGACHPRIHDAGAIDRGTSLSRASNSPQISWHFYLRRIMSMRQLFGDEEGRNRNGRGQLGLYRVRQFCSQDILKCALRSAPGAAMIGHRGRP